MVCSRRCLPINPGNAVAFSFGEPGGRRAPFLAGFLLRRELLKSVVHERLATNAPVNIMMTDLDLNVTYANRRSIDTLKTIEYAMPCKAEDIVGKCIDMFHKNPGRIRKILADPANLPHKSTIQIGNDWMAQTVVAVRDGKGKYIGPMLTWELVTGRLRRSARSPSSSASWPSGFPNSRRPRAN